MLRPTWRCRCLRSALCCSDVTKCAKQRCTIFSSAGNEIKFCTRLFLSFSRFSALAFPGCYVFSPRSREKRICGVLLYRVYAKATVARCIVVRSPPCRSSKRVDVSASGVLPDISFLQQRQDCFDGVGTRRIRGSFRQNRQNKI